MSVSEVTGVWLIVEMIVRALVRGMTRLEFILDPDGLQLENAASRVHLYRIWG